MKEHDCSYSTRIGKTTFIVNVKQSETAQKPLNTVFQEICKHEVLEDYFINQLSNTIPFKPQKIILTKSILMAVASMKLFNDLLNVFVYFCAVEENASAAFPKKFLFSLSWYIFLDVVRVINRFLNTCFIGGFNCFR